MGEKRCLVERRDHEVLYGKTFGTRFQRWEEGPRLDPFLSLVRSGTEKGMTGGKSPTKYTNLVTGISRKTGGTKEKGTLSLYGM